MNPYCKYPVIAQKQSVDEYGLFFQIVVLETPCYPATYYAGSTTRYGWPASNATHKYHYTKECAIGILNGATCVCDRQVNLAKVRKEYPQLFS